MQVKLLTNLLFIALGLVLANAAGVCCEDRKYTGKCTAHPCHLYQSCPSGYKRDSDKWRKCGGGGLCEMNCVDSCHSKNYDGCGCGNPGLIPMGPATRCTNWVEISPYAIAYCNAHADLRIQFCGGGTCHSQDQAKECLFHYEESGRAQGRSSSPYQLFVDDQPTHRPTAPPSPSPTELPTDRPTSGPTNEPTRQPSASPTPLPTTRMPSASPTALPTPAPTNTELPTPAPTDTELPTPTPTTTEIPTEIPNPAPTTTELPTPAPTTTPAPIVEEVATPAGEKKDVLASTPVIIAAATVGALVIVLFLVCCYCCTRGSDEDKSLTDGKGDKSDTPQGWSHAAGVHVVEVAGSSTAKSSTKGGLQKRTRQDGFQMPGAASVSEEETAVEVTKGRLPLGDVLTDVSSIGGPITTRPGMNGMESSLFVSNTMANTPTNQRAYSTDVMSPTTTDDEPWGNTMGNFRRVMGDDGVLAGARPSRKHGKRSKHSAPGASRKARGNPLEVGQGMNQGIPASKRQRPQGSAKQSTYIKVESMNVNFSSDDGDLGSVRLSVPGNGRHAYLLPNEQKLAPGGGYSSAEGGPTSQTFSQVEGEGNETRPMVVLSQFSSAGRYSSDLPTSPADLPTSPATTDDGIVYVKPGMQVDVFSDKSDKPAGMNKSEFARALYSDDSALEMPQSPSFSDEDAKAIEKYHRTANGRLGNAAPSKRNQKRNGGVLARADGPNASHRVPSKKKAYPGGAVRAKQGPSASHRVPSRKKAELNPRAGPSGAHRVKAKLIKQKPAITSDSSLDVLSSPHSNGGRQAQPASRNRRDRGSRQPQADNSNGNTLLQEGEGDFYSPMNNAMKLNGW